MFVRKVAALLKPNSLPEFTHVIECEILPWLRKQEGFLDVMILAVPDSEEVAVISFWDHQANADAYNTSGYPEVLEILGRLLDSAPYVKTFDVVSSTFDIVTRSSGAEHLHKTRLRSSSLFIKSRPE
jgi:heme-degrading monooxygenase HmoA